MPNRNNKYQQNCRICGNEEFIPIIDLGFSPPADAFLHGEDLKKQEIFYPTELRICSNCSLVQLNYVVPPEILFSSDYTFDMSITKSGVVHFESIGPHVKNKFNFKKGKLTVDIGSNTGVLLNGFKKIGFKVLGVEPAKNMYLKALDNGIDTINDFFNNSSAEKILKLKGRPYIITATNVFAHINDLQSFMININSILDDDGIFIIEAPYLLDLLEHLYYDTIYHEHLSYLSIKPLKVLCNKFDFEIFDIEKINYHGGSARYYISRKGDYPISRNLKEATLLENKIGLYENRRLEKFRDSIIKHRINLYKFLLNLKNQGNRIAAVSAPAKGMALLNYCHIDNDLIDFVTEISPFKIGKFTPGTHIPVVSDKKLLDEMPEYAIILAWNFAQPIMKKLENYEKNGGKFIIPFPKPYIVK